MWKSLQPRSSTAQEYRESPVGTVRTERKRPVKHILWRGFWTSILHRTVVFKSEQASDVAHSVSYNGLEAGKPMIHLSAEGAACASGNNASYPFQTKTGKTSMRNKISPCPVILSGENLLPLMLNMVTPPATDPPLYDNGLEVIVFPL